MKIKKIYTFPFAIAAVLFFLSNSSGPGTSFSREVSGAPGNIGNLGTCGNAGCHNAGAFDPTVTLELLNESGEAVDEYIPGQAYTLKVVNTPGTGNPARFGFQAVALDAADSQIGEWGDVGVGKQVVELSGRSYVEHSSPSMQGTFEVEWIAPEAGAGEVTFYSASNAVNNNGNSTGDGTASATLNLQESLPSSSVELERPFSNLEVFPNPVGEELTLEINSNLNGDFNLQVVNTMGTIVQREIMNLSTGTNRVAFDVSQLPAGLYILHLTGEAQSIATQVLKK